MKHRSSQEILTGCFLDQALLQLWTASQTKLKKENQSLVQVDLGVTSLNPIPR